eukprot:CAMPEP_0177618678 /NCGR_PEP_ID=MMETSP0419_2-20121207/25740_1 /TAXON_ID=582737 /ORGANISM="Tetraselmis sp., Strain GSL018" /LENGTH=40 /DNA_ID= /DNA_START= /DNA_END= /DNA_ORIENTATION=
MCRQPAPVTPQSHLTLMRDRCRKWITCHVPATCPSLRRLC